MNKLLLSLTCAVAIISVGSIQSMQEKRPTKDLSAEEVLKLAQKHLRERRELKKENKILQETIASLKDEVALKVSKAMIICEEEKKRIKKLLGHQIYRLGLENKKLKRKLELQEKSLLNLIQKSLQRRKKTKTPREQIEWLQEIDLE